uniref:SCP domain-containing protein n=1 Tax=Varanus komodoensis TaxID=61221 RepID=A0A8D2JDD2_VARKO
FRIEGGDNIGLLTIYSPAELWRKTLSPIVPASNVAVNFCKAVLNNLEYGPLNRSIFFLISGAYCGENFLKSRTALAWYDVISTWGEGKIYFKYGLGPTKHYNYSDPYTQIIWYKSYLVGCALSYCRKYAIPFFYVCQYCPVGNIQGKINTPYKEGPSCGDCPNNCENNLCKSCKKKKKSSCYQSSLCHFLRTAAPGRFHLSGAATKTLSGTSAK